MFLFYACFFRDPLIVKIFVYGTHWRVQVASVIKELKIKKSCGMDGISNEILKCCSPIIERHLARAFNKCIDEGVLPNIFKTAKVVPLFKKGEKKDPANYPPISLLSSLSKVFEKILQNRMLRFTEKNNLFCPIQYGFRINMYCVDTIVAITEFIRTEIDEKTQGHACFIDLQKTFDTLDHDIILKKLLDCGFKGKRFEILKDNFQTLGSTSVITLFARKSSKLYLVFPRALSWVHFCFFCIFLDIHLYIGKHCIMSMFADDTTILSSQCEGSCSIQSDMDNLLQWFCQKRLSIVRDKCEAVEFGRGHPIRNLLLDKKVPNSNACKYLGVYVNKMLRFREHIDYVVKTLIKILWRNKSLTSSVYTQKYLLMFNNSFAKSRICHGLLIYVSAVQTNLSKIGKRNEELCEVFFSRGNFIPYMIFSERTKFCQFLNSSYSRTSKRFSCSLGQKHLNLS